METVPASWTVAVSTSNLAKGGVAGNNETGGGVTIALASSTSLRATLARAGDGVISPISGTGVEYMEGGTTVGVARSLVGTSWGATYWLVAAGVGVGAGCVVVAAAAARLIFPKKPMSKIQRDRFPIGEGPSKEQKPISEEKLRELDPM